MNIEELKASLIEKGFNEEKQDTGYEYTKTLGEVELLCYIEPHIKVRFVVFYRWQEDGNENGVKGTYDVSVEKIRLEKEPLPILFKRTLTDMPECIGDKANAHSEVKKAIDELFG